MLVSCRYCSRLHKRGETCSNRPKNNRTKEANYISRFRSLRIWQKKRDEIKKRDRFLCQYCLTKNRYIFQKLEVHHIEPISTSWNNRLENSNLITLCVDCHKRAELGEIGREKLKEIVKTLLTSL